MGRKAVVFLICATMLLTVFSACSKTEKEPDSTTTSSLGSAATTAGQTGAEREELTLDIFIMQGAAAISGLWDDFVAQKLLDDLNLRLNIWPTGGTEVQTKMRSYIAADSLPDFVGFNDNIIAQEAVDAGRLLKLNEYASYMPNIFENDFFEPAVRYHKKNFSDGTGENIYTVPTGVGPAAYNGLIWTPMLRWAPYRDAGYPKIATLEDYIDVFELMLEKYPTNEAGEKVYALSLRPGYGISELSFYYGIARIGKIMEVDVTTNEIKPLTAEDAFFKRALKFAYEVNKRGMLDPDSVSQTFDDQTAKISAGRVLFTMYSWQLGTFNQAGSGHVNNEENPDALVPIVADDMKLYELPHVSVGGLSSRMFSISSRSKYKERVAEFLNWLYDIETTQYFHVGPEGVLWEMVDGRPAFTETGWEVIGGADVPLPGGGKLPDPRSVFNTIAHSDGTINPYTGDTIGYWSWKSYVEQNTTLAHIQFREFLGTTVFQDYLEERGMVAKPSQAINMVPAISGELELTATSIIEVLENYAWKITLAKDDNEFEELWDEMVATVNGLGMEEVAKFYENGWYEALEIVKEYE